MILKTRDRFGSYPEKLVSDTAYGSASMPGWLLEEEGIELFIPVIDKSERKDGTFLRDHFAHDREGDSHTCPGGKQLVQFRRTDKRPRSGIDKEGLMRCPTARRTAMSAP